jgi:hypothetical protein
MRRVSLAAAAVALALTLMTLAAGCGSDHCGQLAQTLCAPAAIEPCLAFVEGQLQPAGGAALAPEARQAACKLILADDKTLALYRERYRQPPAAPAP